MNLEIERSNIELKLYEMSLDICKAEGYELYDMVYIPSSSTLRVFIMDPETGSAVIEDCIAVDRAFTEPVEAASWISDDFVLEVSSPGVYREIKTKEHLDQAVDQIVLVVVKGDIDLTQFDGKPPKGVKGKSFRGTLLSFDEDKIKISLEKHNAEFYINIEQIKKINLDPNL